MFTIEVDSAEEGFIGLLKSIKRAPLVCPRKFNTLEIVNACLVLSNTDNNIVTNPVRNMNHTYALIETLWYWSGRNDLGYLIGYNKKMSDFSDDGITLKGAYGPPFKEQLSYVKETLRKDRDSRQAMITLWKQCPKESKDIPCTIMMHFMIRDMKLLLTVYMRSNDLWLGFPYDIWAFTTIQKQVAADLGYAAGPYTHIVGSMHIYENDWPKINWALKYPGPTYIELPCVNQGDLTALYEDSLMVTEEPMPSRFAEVHAILRRNYIKKKRGEIYYFPQPYFKLREESSAIRAKIGSH